MPLVPLIIILTILFVNTTSKSAQPGRSQIPVLCYHNIKPDTTGKSPGYTISCKDFEAQMKMLADSGYTSVLPDQLLEYLVNGIALPPKPIMITFDDSHAEHFWVAAPVLKKYGFKGVFFVMAVTINKAGYLSAEQIKNLSDSGHVIGGHSWDHPDMRKILVQRFDEQVKKSNLKLEHITGKPVCYFAYPNGAWNDSVIKQLRTYGIKAAFQLSMKQSESVPLFTLRRLLVSGSWPPNLLHKKIKASFHSRAGTSIKP